MKSKNSIIVINGRHYDAHTGKPLHGQTTSETAAASRAPAPAVHKPHAGRTSADYRPTRHIRPHKTEHAHTLMRQAVKKPGPSAGRRIKVQGHLGSGGRESSRIITHREPASYARHDRNHAVKVTHSRLISHFSPQLFAVDSHTSLAVYGSGAVDRSAHRVAPKAAPRELTTDELLEFAVQHAKAPRHHVAARRRRVIRHPHAGRHA